MKLMSNLVPQAIEPRLTIEECTFTNNNVTNDVVYIIIITSRVYIFILVILLTTRQISW